MKAENFVKAQALKDVTMAYFILDNYKKGAQFIHYNGNFHSLNRGGIIGTSHKKTRKLK